MSDYLGHEDGCPICFHKLDAATCVSGTAPPKPGDLTVCVYCAEPLMFDESLRHVCLDQHGGIDSLAADERKTLLEAQKLIRERSSCFKRVQRKPS